MANNLKISVAARNAACNAIVDLLDAGAAGGTIKIYDGTQPATPDTAVSTQTLLATVTMSTTAFGSASSASATLAGTTLSATASASGTAAWFRMSDSDGTAVMDGSVGTSSADLTVNTTTIVSGNTVQITSGSVTMPAG
jgi:hypothetical protein